MSDNLANLRMVAEELDKPDGWGRAALEIRWAVDEIGRLEERYRREHEAHAANLKEQQKCEAELHQLRLDMARLLATSKTGGSGCCITCAAHVLVIEDLRRALAGMIEAVRDVEIDKAQWEASVARHLRRAYDTLGIADPRAIAALVNEV